MSFRIWYPIWFSVSSYLGSGFSSFWAAIMRDHWLWMAAKLLYAPLVTTILDRLGVFLWTGMRKFLSFDGFACGFRFWSNFLRFWIIFCGFTVSIKTQCPLHLWLFDTKVGWFLALFCHTFFIVKSSTTLTKHPGLLKSGIFDKFRDVLPFGQNCSGAKY